MDFVHLIQLVIPREKREKGQDFKIDAAYSPVVHLVVVVAVGEEALGRPVPPRADILCEGRLGVDAPTGAKVGQLHLIFFQKNVLRLDVTMKDAVSVHVIDRFEHLVHVVLDALLGQVVAPSLDRLVHVHVHEFED